MLFFLLLFLFLLVYMEYKVCDGFECPETQNTCNDGDKVVAFCIRKKEPNRDHCDTEPLSKIYEYPHQCLPTNCPAKIRDYCASNPCKNEGACKNFPGSYSCKCKSGYHGRDCSIQGGQGYSSNIYFIYDPIVGWKRNQAGVHQEVVRSKAIIFLSNVGADMSIVFTTSCSVEKKISPKKNQKTEKLAREKCELEFIENETVKNYFCKYLPQEKMVYAKLYYDIPFDSTNEPIGSVITSYNRETQSDMAGFKVSKLAVAVYNGKTEEYKESFNQINILQRVTASECQTPVNLLVSGMRCVKPLKRKRNEKISIKSVFETQLKFASGLICNYLFPSYNWETFDYSNTIFKPIPPKDQTLPSKNCSQFGSSNHNCHESFEIEPFELDIGTYEIKLTVNAVLKKSFDEKTSDTFPIETFGLYFIEIEMSPLIAVIEGGDSRTVSKDDLQVVIDGSRSYDPNTPPDDQSHLEWSWSCSGLPANRCCKDLTGKICEVVERLEKEKKYEFSLTITAPYGISASVTQKLTVSNKPQAQLEIRCLKNCGLDGFKTNPKETVYMEVRVADKTKKSADMTFNWKYSCVSRTAMESVEDIKQDGVDSHILIVKEDKLTPGTECKFTVDLDSTIEESEGRSSIIIQVNKPLVMGVCKISFDCEPNKCFKAKAKFTISCSNFTYDIESVQLVYSFYQKEGQVSPGTLLGFSMSGELNDVTLTDNTVTVRVSDQFGMYIDYETKVPVELKDWIPNEKEMDEMLNSLETFVTSRDSSSSAMIVGAIIDVMGNMSKKSEIIEKVLDSLSKDYVNDLSDVKLYTSTMKKIVTKGIKESKTQIGSKIVESLGVLMEQLSSRLLLVVNYNSKEFPAVSDSEIQDIALTMVESADVIASSEDEKALDVKTGTLAVFARTNQYKSGTASMIGGLVFSGMAILDTLLPHQQEVVIRSESTTMWAKVESPVSLANNSGIPQNSSTKIKMAKEFGNKLQRISENVALQVITFDNNPYWWDVEDRDVASEIISVSTWKQPESGLRAFDNKLITDISEELDVYLKFKTTRFETVTGTVMMPEVSASEDAKDAAVAVHTLEGPPENSNGMLFVEFKNLGNTEFRVLLTENIRPDYEIMKESKKVIAQSPLISLPYNNITADTLHFIGILPGGQESPGRTLNYTFAIYSIQCKMRQETVWTSPACRVGEETTKDVVHCKCSHMSFFGSSIFVAPNTVHPIKDLKLLLTVKDNPLVFTVILIILIAYVMLLVWALLKDKNDKLKRNVIVLEDNFPGESYSYLIVVHTSFNYGSGTDANVGIMLLGSIGPSRVHILRSNHRRVFRRNSDDWFLILSPTSLGELRAIHLWHDNSGSHPDWFCQKVVVYDIPGGKDYTFIVEQWLSVWPGEFTEAVAFPSRPEDIYEWKRVIVHNILYNMREKHLWLSIYMSHPRATVSKSQRVTIAFCVVLITLLTGVMFYGVARGGIQNDDPEYKLKLRVLVVAVQSAVLSTLATAPVVICFRRSQIVTLQQNNKRPRSSVSEIESISDLTKVNTGKKAFLKNFMSKMVRGKPLIPVLVGKESAESVIIRRRWARFGWVMSQIVIWGSGYLIILYGLKLGKVISKLWITSAGLAISTGAFLNSPMKIVFVSMILSMFGEIYNITTYEYKAKRPMKQELFGDVEHMANLIKLRSSSIYKPKQRKKIAEYRKAALRRLKLVDGVEFFASIFLFLVLLSVSGDLWQVKSFHITSHITHSLTVSHTPMAVPLNQVVNVKRITDYLVSKLFRGLYKGRWYNKRLRLSSPEESLAKMGWFSDTVHRMVGIPRMRQLRVRTDNCPWAGLFNTSHVVCIFGLRPDTEDTRNYGLHWGNITKDVNKPLLSPWTYQNDDGQGVFVYGASDIPYHTGGYTVDLYDTQDQCNTLISDLTDLEWWDIRMRAFITELTLYNPNTDTYSLVSVVTEHLPSGAFTNRIHVMSVHLETNLFLTTLYLGVLIFFNVNLFLFMNRKGIASTLSYFWGCYDLLFVGLSDFAMTFHILKAIRVSTAVHVFKEAGSSGFFYFSNIVWYQKTTLSVWSLVLCLTPIRILKFNPFVSTCKAACYTLYKARKLLVAVSAIIIVFTLIQLFMINFKIFPESSPFEFDSRFHKTNKKGPFDSSSGYCAVRPITSLLLAILFGMSILILQMILINVYKAVLFLYTVYLMLWNITRKCVRDTYEVSTMLFK